MARLLKSLVACCLLATAPVAAAPTGQGTLNAVAFQPLPEGRAITVRVLDDSADNLAVKAELETALRRLGWAVEQDAPLVLTIEGRDSIGAWSRPPSTTRIQVRDDRGRVFPQGELDISQQARLPLPATTVVTPAQFRLGLTLDSAGNGMRLWQGWSIAELSQGEPPELAQAMVPKLAGSVGRTVREETFDLQ